MHGNRGTLAALSVAALCCGVAVSARPAGARRQVANITGSYFGSFTASNGNQFQSDVNITNQLGRRFGGLLNVGAVINDSAFGGVVLPSGDFTISGTAGRRPNLLHLKLRGRHIPGEGGANEVLEGTFIATGRFRMRGTFRVNGPIRRDAD